MADDTIAFMEAMGITNAHIVGWSDGGNVGMLMAIRRPDLVRTLVSIGGNFHFSGLTAGFRASMLSWTVHDAGSRRTRRGQPALSAPLLIAPTSRRI